MLSTNKVDVPDEWPQYQALVLSELSRHNTLLEKLNDKLDINLSRVNGELATLRVKAGLWGMFGAAVPIGIALGLKLITPG
tara:strand:- start:2874 stop:3116 length:243 start_codon:yes stop_codon:yes gene_type:complete